MSPDDLLAGCPWRILCGDSSKALAELDSDSIDCGILDPPAGIRFMGKGWDDDHGGRDKWIRWITPIFQELFRLLKPGGHAFVWALPRTSHWTATALEDAGLEIRDVIGHAFGSGFPKSLDLSKAIDAAAGAKREAVRPLAQPRRAQDSTSALGGGWQEAPMVTAPATDDARRFAGWGTALKPAIEHWIMVRKPLKGTVAACALRHGTGGINVDAARVGSGADKGIWPATSRPNPTFTSGSAEHAATDTSAGRWPANLLLSHCSWIESACSLCGVVVPFAAKYCAACGAPVECRRGGCVEHGTKTVAGSKGGETSTAALGVMNDDGWQPRKRVKPRYDADDGTETVPAWSCLATCPDCERSILAPSGGEPPFCLCMKRMRWACPVAMIDAQSGESASSDKPRHNTAAAHNRTSSMGQSAADWTTAGHADTGGASRFFNTFGPEPLDPWEPLIYVPKPSTAEREAGCEKLPKKSAGELTDREEGSAGTKSPRAGAGRTSSGRGNHHPTVKPRDLLRHFYRLGCPRNGIAVDLFGGSGTTATIAAANEDGEGWRCIAVELDPEHVKIGEARCAWWEREGRGALFATPAAPVSAPAPAVNGAPKQLDMFGGQR